VKLALRDIRWFLDYDYGSPERSHVYGVRVESLTNRQDAECGQRELVFR
jgi:hypothetical protein